MKRVAILFLLAVLGSSGCTKEDRFSGLEISGFIDLLKDKGIEGTLDIDKPSNEDIEYVANYVISKYTSTRIISFFKFTSLDRAERNLQDALKNPKMSGQALNGAILMTATFYPPDEEAVEKIRELFLGFELPAGHSDAAEAR